MNDTQKVILRPVPGDIYKDSNLEPQYVCTRSISSASIYLSSSDPVQETNKVNMLMSTIKSSRDNANTLFSNICRVKVSNVHVRYITPNVNARNNQVIFFSSNSNLFHEVLLTPGFYSTTEDLITELQDSLNSISGVSGLTFSFSTFPNQPDTYILSSIGGNYIFADDCSACVKGRNLYNLPVDLTPTNAKLIGTMNLFYTTFIDFCSVTLTKYAKVKDNSTGYASNIILRAYITDPRQPHSFTQEDRELTAFNYNSGDSVNLIDIQLYDEFGELLYLPEGSAGTAGGFQWIMRLIVEA